jgi:hypothetical protein
MMDLVTGTTMWVVVRKVLRIEMGRLVIVSEFFFNGACERVLVDEVQTGPFGWADPFDC